MLKKLYFDMKTLVAIISFLVMGISVSYFAFRNDPPELGKVLSARKAGVIELEIPSLITINSPFEVTVQVDSQKQNVNAVGFYMKYNPKHLELVDFDTSESFCQFYPEKKYDNSLGLMSLACGSPHPGFSGVSNLITLTFRPLVVTNTQLIVDPKSKILLSDGSGTNILQEFPSEQVSILNSL